MLTQFTASSRRAVSLHSSTRAATAALCGMVTDSPRMPAARIASSAAAASPGATSKAKERQRPARPRAAKALACSSGESEWATGLPITPTIVTSGPASRRASSIVSGVTSAQGRPRDLASCSFASCSA